VENLSHRLFGEITEMGFRLQRIEVRETDSSVVIYTREDWVTDERSFAVTSDQSTATTNRSVATITADGTKTIQEAGLLTASTSGTLIIRGTHTAVPVNASDQIQYTFTMAHTAA